VDLPGRDVAEAAAMKRTLAGLLGVIVVLAVSGCGKGQNGPGPVLVFVAASTRDAVQKIAADFTEQHGIEVRISADASSRLASQIGRDAPADLFLSANDEWAQFVKDNGYAAEVHPLLGNALVLVVPEGNPARVTGPKDLTGSALRRLALAGPAVPAGKYARQALEKLGLWDDLERQKKVVSGEDVRVALAYVERGEAEAGIVYATDARITDKVRQVYAFDPSTHDPVRYPLVLLKAGREKEGARKFYEFLQSSRAAKVFERHGFTVLKGK